MERGLIRVSVIAFCHDGRGNYLISKRSQGCRDEQGTWEPVAGGGVKFGEKIDDAVRREIREEAGGASVEAVEYLGYSDVFRVQNAIETHWIAHNFRVQINPADAKIGEPHKCDEQRWVTIAELEQMENLHSQFPAFLEKYRERLQ